MFSLPQCTNCCSITAVIITTTPLHTRMLNRCQWKIGVAHEGHFPGRKRIVFRPRFENEYGETFRSASAAHSSTALFHEHAAKQRKEKRQLRKAKDSRNDLDEVDNVSAETSAAIGLLDGETAKLDSEVYSDEDGDEEAEDSSSRLAVASAVSTATKSRSMDDNADASDPNSDLRTVRALAVACAGYIKDVADPIPSLPPSSSFPSSSSLASSSALEFVIPTPDTSEGKGNPNQVHVPGSGWGLVDADDSEEGGFGVVGLANPTDHSPPISTGASNQVEEMLAGQASDMMGDVRQLEDNFKHGRNYTDTGPCHSGTRYVITHFRIDSFFLNDVDDAFFSRVGSGPAKFASRVMMVTASGNFWGHLSFNGKEVFFCSSLEPEVRAYTRVEVLKLLHMKYFCSIMQDGLNEDSAAVNLAKRRRMRRRRWVVSKLAQPLPIVHVSIFALPAAILPLGYLLAAVSSTRQCHGGVLHARKTQKFLRRLRPHQVRDWVYILYMKVPLTLVRITN